ncbi:Ferric siderophore transport system, periplasmic binding protein TonB [Pseudomonas marincola]|uniref:TonB C-terminal domain-containing protein n=1 Tax=Pseudomonas marincola TaxID=437900 RepID=A0A653DZ68_9PSED|nr:energy transducer TonB [Pseudomonas marincola]CAE6940294.1 Ferric siderophore transport system, periplasmic binding protein TonB [Pseudomonas marincola]
MLRWPLFLLLSLAAHVAASWLLREPVQPLAGQQADAPQVLRIAAIQLQAAAKQEPVAPPSAPASEPPPAVATAKPEPVSTPAVKTPVAPVPVAKPVVAAPKPAVAEPKPKPVVAPEPAPRVASASSAQPSAPEKAAGKAKAPATPKPVAAPVTQSPEPVEVVSHQPSFLQPPKPPSYPATARRRNQEGTVLVEVRLDRNGAQRDVQVLRSSGVSSLDQAAVKAVSGWRFKPETVAGQPVPSRVQIPIAFALAARR